MARRIAPREFPKGRRETSKRREKREAVSSIRSEVSGSRCAGRPAIARRRARSFSAVSKSQARVGLGRFQRSFDARTRLLTDPAHADLQKRLTSQTRLLLVDECQDTDPLQVELIKALCGTGRKRDNLFFVGDFKQSIYRFRGADPTVFRQLQQETPIEGRLPLTTNLSQSAGDFALCSTRCFATCFRR